MSEILLTGLTDNASTPETKDSLDTIYNVPTQDTTGFSRCLADQRSCSMSCSDRPAQHAEDIAHDHYKGYFEGHLQFLWGNHQHRTEYRQEDEKADETTCINIR